MSELSWGQLETTILAGREPDSILVQVVATKLMSGGDDFKFRVMLWDGKNVYKNGLLTIPSEDPPSPFSIIKLGKRTPPGKREPVLKKIQQGGEETFAYVFNHYDLVKNGSEIGKKLQMTLPSTPGDLSAATSSKTTPLPPLPKKRKYDETPGTPSRQEKEAVKRNLETTYSPVKRQLVQDLDDKATHLVQALNPYTNKYKIKVRVTQKNEKKEIANSRWQGTVQDCILSDRSGQIKLTAFGNETDKLNNLEMFKSYMLTGAKLQPVRDTRYNHTGHQYEMVWTQNTQVHGPLLGCADNAATCYNFVPIKQILESSVYLNKTVDVCGVVVDTGSIRELRSKSDRDLKKRDVTLCDNTSGYDTSVKLTLWNEKAVEFDSAPGTVLAVKGAKVDEYNGLRQIGLGFSGFYEVEPSHQDRVQELIGWRDENANQLSQSASQSQSQGTSIEDCLSLAELKTGNSQTHSRRAKVVGYILQVKDDNITYRAHVPPDGTKCNKKVTKGTSPDTWACNKCGKYNIHTCDTNFRYKVRVSVGDFSDAAWCDMFQAESLFCKTADEVQELQTTDPDEYMALIKSLQLVPMLFSVSAKIESYNSQQQLKIMIHEISRIDWKDKTGGSAASQLMAARRKQIAALSAQLGVSVADEFGVDLD